MTNKGYRFVREGIGVPCAVCGHVVSSVVYMPDKTRNVFHEKSDQVCNIGSRGEVNVWKGIAVHERSTHG